MRHFHHLPEAVQEELFHRRPLTVTTQAPRHLLASSLGAALYMPATRPHLLEDLRRQHARGCGTIIVCLEDSISDHDLPQGEANVVGLLTQVAEAQEELPLLFVRVRTPAHLRHLLTLLSDHHLRGITGFAFPKFGESLSQAREFLQLMAEVNGRPERHHLLYCLPILETGNLAHLETRVPHLLALRDLLQAHRASVLGVRIGATDLSSVYGIRRSPEVTVYEVAVLASVISDMVNIFGRAQDGFVISGSVWEHFVARERLFKPTLRRSPFQRKDEVALRTELVLEQLDGFIREVELDKVNGLLGKTVIHPTHVAIVNALSIVTFEEFEDAEAVLALEAGGAVGSRSGNKMNEGRPHHNWAQGVMVRAQAFGVLRSGVEFPHVLHALHREEAR